MSDSFPPFDYHALIAKHKLTLLEKPADLVFRNGDIAVTRWRDLSLGTTAFDGIFRFFNEWRYNEPTLRRMFDAQLVMAKREAVLRSKMEGLAVRLAGAASEDQAIRSTEYHDNREELISIGYGRNAYSEAIILKLSALLQQLKDDVYAPPEDWNSTPPTFDGYSLGQVIVAAGNCVRHRDEWIKADKADKRQQNSRTVLEAVLPRQSHGIGFLAAVPQETLLLISGGIYNVLSAHLLGFAHEIALRKEAKEE